MNKAKRARRAKQKKHINSKKRMGKKEIVDLGDIFERYHQDTINQLEELRESNPELENVIGNMFERHNIA